MKKHAASAQDERGARAPVPAKSPPAAKAPDRLPASALPTLRQLQFLLAVFEQGGFQRAAESVGVTQPTLSAGIKELETALGARLIERGRAGAVLTPAGAVAVERAARALAETEALVTNVRDAAEPFAGAFRLGAIPTIAPYVLPHLMRRLQARFPRLQLQLREDMTGRLIESLRARALDAAIIALPFDAAGIDTEYVAPDEFLFVGPKGHPLAAQETLTPGDMAAEEMLLLEDGHCLRDHALSVCRIAGGRNDGKSAIAGKADFGATSLQTLVQMVAGGMGVTLAPRLAVEGGVAAGANVSVRAFSRPVFGRSIGVAWRHGAARAREAKLLAAILKERVSGK